MTSFKYKINERVKERNSNRIHGRYINHYGKQEIIKTRRGIVTGMNIKKNSIGAKVTYYQVQWDNQSRPTEIQAHRIESEETK
tara:strand:- start:155 stop:403 length:249 start_codon:yes stop_codon:yes gene_type:complete